jgi:hypothetical protein
MQPTTYARLVLFLPYLFLLGTWAYLIAMDPEMSAGIGLHNLSFVWAYSAMYWVVPYSHLVLCLLIWSRGKSFEMIAVVYSLAPCALAVVTLILFIIVQLAIWIDTGQMWEGLNTFAITGMLTVLADLIVGYVFVVIAFSLFVLLKRIGFIKAAETRTSTVRLFPLG